MRPRLAALALALAALAAPASAAPKARTHVAVEGEQDCAACHREGTAAVFADWERSPHGLALVKCVVCHGSTGKDFRAKPDTSGCNGCHSTEVASLARRPVKDCFACHAPHSLSPNPHR